MARRFYRTDSETFTILGLVAVSLADIVGSLHFSACIGPVEGGAGGVLMTYGPENFTFL